MAKKVTGSVKLQIAAGKATPAPPVGPALGQAQINIMEFCKQFNAKTSAKELDGLIIPVVVSVYTRSLLHLHHQDAAGCDSVEAGCRRGEGLGHAQQGQGWQGHREAGAGDRQAEDARPERGFGGGGGEEREGHRALDGYRSNGVKIDPTLWDNEYKAVARPSRKHHGHSATRNGGGRQGAA